METPTACGVCGHRAPVPVPLDWACETTRGGVERVLCPGCVRRHVREIEARLDP